MKLGLGLGLITAINAGGPGARRSFFLFPFFFILAPMLHVQVKLTGS